VVRNNDAALRVVAPQHHMAAALPLKDESRAFQGAPDISAREASRKLRHHG
jgi:hypothetical protein